MSSEEQRQILKMIEDGKITPEEAMQLLGALGEDDANEETEAFFTEAGPTSEREPDENLQEIADKVRRLWRIPLWIGVGFAALGGLWMFGAMQKSGFGFWFYCAWLPFLLGIAAIALASGSRTARWLFVRVKQAPGETPQNITLGFPLPLRFSGWILRNFGHYLPGLNDLDVNEIIKMLDALPAGEAPLIVDVHEEDGEHVQVFIG